MGLLIDTNILIDLERGLIGKQQISKYQKSEPVYISVITVSELLYGAERAQNPTTQARRHSFIERIITSISILDIELNVARRHAQISALLASQGKIIGAHDLWIAATSLVHDLTLVTCNVKEFERVPGLILAKDFN